MSIQVTHTASRIGATALLAASLCIGALRAQDQGAQKPADAPQAPAATQQPAQSADTTRATLERWVEARKQSSKARSDWRVEKESLQERVDIVRRQIATLKERIAETEKSIGAADQQKTQLQADGAKIKVTTDRLEAGVAALEEQVRALLPRLPDPIQQKVAPLSQQFRAPVEGVAQKKLSVGARFGNVLGVLNLVQKWNNEVSVTSEVRTLPDGTTAEVACIYFGLGQGFYVSAKGDAAGVGLGTPEGWKWTPRNDAAQAIQAAIDVYQSKAMASFVGLPFEIQ
ncbi:MAG: hypothetical protein RLZZ562_1855 [Planctomycetota bacterium]|jgi:hypothetical protein